MRYYDWKKEELFKPEVAACSFDLWMEEHTEHPCARHQDGFLVFLDPSVLLDSDEYHEHDPYSVEENFAGEFHRRRTECTLSFVRSAVGGTEKGKRILDLGCGEGYITKKIYEMFPEADIYGLDYSITAIRTAARTVEGVEFIVADAYRLPYESDCFDLVVCNNMWEHVPDPCRLLHGIRRIVKPSGYLVVSTPSRYRLWNLLRALCGRPVNFMSLNHVTEYTVGQVIEQMRYGGFRVISVRGSGARGERSSLKEVLVNGALLPMGRLFLRVVRSHHCLDATVFVLARREK